MWCYFPFPRFLLGWKHLVIAFLSKGLDQSLSVYPVHEDIPYSKAIRCGFVLSLGGYLGLEGPDSVWGTQEGLCNAWGPPVTTVASSFHLVHCFEVSHAALRWATDSSKQQKANLRDM